MRRVPRDYFSIRLWAVVGPAHAGKSSVIGALTSQTGKGAGGDREILLRGGGWLQIHALRQSVQESGQTPNKSIDKITAKARHRQSLKPFAFFNVLLALRSDAYKSLPLADDYLAEYVKAGWDLQALILLNVSCGLEFTRYAQFGAPALQLATTEWIANDMYRNWVFGYARNHLGWA